MFLYFAVTGAYQPTKHSPESLCGNSIELNSTIKAGLLRLKRGALMSSNPLDLIS